jgi:hypothetical protein
MERERVLKIWRHASAWLQDCVDWRFQMCITYMHGVSDDIYMFVAFSWNGPDETTYCLDWHHVACLRFNMCLA